MQNHRILLLLSALILIPLLPLQAGGQQEIPADQLPAVDQSAPSGAQQDPVELFIFSDPSVSEQLLSPNGDDFLEKTSIGFSLKTMAETMPAEDAVFGISIAGPDGKEVFRTTSSSIPAPGYRSHFDLTWDGADQDRMVLADGLYTPRLFVYQNGGIAASLVLDPIELDSTPPEINFIKPENLLFSPNGDGFHETLTISHIAEEADWTAFLIDRNKDIVRQYYWKNQVPEPITLDGTDDSGRKLRDGLYFYKISGKDAAGNSTGEILLEGIEIDSTLPELELSVNYDAFSPNSDGYQDTVLAIPQFTYRDRVVDWEGTVEGTDTPFSMSFRGRKKDPFPFTFKGLNEENGPLPEGIYRIRYSLTYRNGIQLTQSVDVEIDLTFPDVDIRYEEKFTPNQDFNNDEEDIVMSSDEGVTFRGEIVNQQGKALKVFSAIGTSAAVSWDGSDQFGKAVPDGTYYLAGRYQDPAGNGANLDPPYPILVDSRPTGIDMQIPSGFSPNKDDIDDLLPVGIIHDVPNILKTWKITFESEGGTKIQSYSGGENIPDTVFWDGSIAGKTGTTAEDGRYLARLSLTYKDRSPVEFLSRPFLLDTHPPRIRLQVSPANFERGTDRVFGTVPITIGAEDESDVGYWILDIKNKEGEIVRSYEGDGDPREHIWWNGRDNDDKPVEDPDQYTFQVTVIDKLGNKGVLQEDHDIDVVVIWKDGKYYLLVPNIIFGAYKHDIDSAGPVMLKRNRETLRKVLKAFTKYPDRSLTLEGHALNIYRGGPGEEGEEDILGPLTQRRASTVRDELISMGFDPERISVEFFGGREPMAPVDDLRVRWKNRRVEFVMSGEELAEPPEDAGTNE